MAILITTVNRPLILSFDDCSSLIKKSLINGFLIFSAIKYPLNIFWYLRHDQCIQPTDSFNMWGNCTNKIRIPKNFMLHRHRRIWEQKSFLYKNFSYFISTSRPLAFFNEKVYPPTKGIPHENWVFKLLDLLFKVTVASSLVFKEYHPNLVKWKKAWNMLRKKSELNIVLKWVNI